MNRIHNGTAELRKILENYIYEIGINEIARVSDTALNVSLYAMVDEKLDERLCSKDASVYVETIIDIHKRFFQLIQDAFNSEKMSTISLDKVRMASRLDDWASSSFRHAVNSSITMP